MKRTYKAWEQSHREMLLSITHSIGLGKFSCFPTTVSVLCWSPLADGLNPLNQNSYNNFWSLLATWLSTTEDVFIDSQRWEWAYIKSAFPPCLNSLVLCFLNSRVTIMVSLLFHTFIHSFLLSYIFSRHVTHYSLDVSKRRSNFCLSVFETKV